MFLFTVTKPGLRQAGALALCAVCLAGTVTAAVRLAGKSVAASATVQTTIENTQDIGTYFTGYGFEVDLSTAAVDKVKIPKKWDDSFTAFNQVVGESGLTLADYKGKTVEKWTVLCPARSDGATDTYCVLLVYKAKPVGAYLLEKPSGEVSGLPTGIKRVTALCRWAVWLCVALSLQNFALFPTDKAVQIIKKENDKVDGHRKIPRICQRSQQPQHDQHHIIGGIP